MVVEQINYWLGKYKFKLKHMSYERFHFFIYIIFNEYNNIKMEGKKISQFNDISRFNPDIKDSEFFDYESD
jgi:hypothetical protein